MNVGPSAATVAVSRAARRWCALSGSRRGRPTTIHRRRSRRKPIRNGSSRQKTWKARTSTRELELDGARILAALGQQPADPRRLRVDHRHLQVAQAKALAHHGDAAESADEQSAN